MILRKRLLWASREFLFIALLGVLSLSVSNTFGLPFKVGDPFPSLTLPTLDGRPLSIESLKGKKTVLHIWASW